MKNPNGYGSVVKLSGNRRRPYAVRKTIGFNEKGHPIYKFLAYTETRREGLLILAKYNSAPYSIADMNITTAGIFERYMTAQSERLSNAQKGSLNAAFRHCSDVAQTPYAKLNSLMIQAVIDACPRGASTKASIKNLFRHLDRFAMEMNIITRERCLMVTVPPTPDSTRRPFTSEEIALLWSNAGEDWVDTVLIFIYTGMRLSELLSVKRGDVDERQRIITGGVKTAAGRNRVIPIHSAIFPLVSARLENGGEYLLSLPEAKDAPCSKSRYYSEWGKLMARFNMNHTPHECRHTFRSLLDSAGANKCCIDLIMGHKSKDVGERVYTHKTVEELKAAVEMIEVSGALVTK